jgi:hypothetical protein
MEKFSCDHYPNNQFLNGYGFNFKMTETKTENLWMNLWVSDYNLHAR